MGNILQIPGVLVSIGAIVGGAVIGLLYLVGVFGRFKNDEIGTAKKASEFVIETLEKKIKILEDNQKNMGDRLVAIEAENKVLRDVLQGRDGDSITFQQLGMEALTKTLPVLMATTDRTEKNLTRLYNLIADHYEAIEKMQRTTMTTTVHTGGQE